MSRCGAGCTARSSSAATGSARCAPTDRSELARLERPALVGAAGLEAALEPAHALRARAMREALGHDGAARLALQRVVADLRGGIQRGLDVALLQPPRAHRLGALGPHTGEAIGLQLQA